MGGGEGGGEGEERGEVWKNERWKRGKCCIKVCEITLALNRCAYCIHFFDRLQQLTVHLPCHFKTLIKETMTETHNHSPVQVTC